MRWLAGADQGHVEAPRQVGEGFVGLAPEVDRGERVLGDGVDLPGADHGVHDSGAFLEGSLPAEHGGTVTKPRLHGLALGRHGVPEAELDQPTLEVVALVGEARGLAVEPPTEVEGSRVEEPKVLLRGELHGEVEGLDHPEAARGDPPVVLGNPGAVHVVAPQLEELLEGAGLQVSLRRTLWHRRLLMDVEVTDG